MVLPDVVAGDPHVAAHNAERHAVNSLEGAPPRAAATQPPLSPLRTAVTTFQPGHGWTGTGFASVTDDTADAFFAAQSARLVTDTAGTSATFDSPVYAAIDLTRRELAFPIKIGNLAAVTDLRIYAGDGTLANAKNISFKPIEISGDDFQYLKEGEWCWFTISFDTGSDIGTPDKTAVSKFRLRVQAASGQTVTVHLGGLFMQRQDYAAAFPNGVASCTYDDGRATGYERALAMAGKYGFRFSFYPIWDRLGLGDPYVSLQQIIDAQARGHEVGCHAETGANHNLGFTELGSTQAVEDELLAERNNFYASGLGDIPGFAWPRGMSSAAVEAAARKVVSYGRGIYTASGNTRETLPPANPMRVRAYSVGSTTTLAALQSFIDKTVIAGDWAVLVFHEVRPVLLNDGAPECLQSVHDGIIDYIAGLTNAPTVLPVIDVIRRMPSPELTDIPVGGDLTGTMSSATVTKINGAPISGIPSTGKVLMGIGAGASWQPVVGADTWSVNNRIVGGEGVFPRMLATGSQASASGRMLLTYCTAEVSETTTQMALGTASIAAAPTPTLVRAGIYEIDVAGNGTLVAAILNDTTIFAAATAKYIRTLISALNKVAGKRYATGILVVSTQTLPNYPGISMQGSNAFATAEPRLAGSIDGLTDLPSTFLSTDVASQKFMPYVEMLR